MARLRKEPFDVIVLSAIVHTSGVNDVTLSYSSQHHSEAHNGKLRPRLR